MRECALQRVGVAEFYGSSYSIGYGWRLGVSSPWIDAKFCKTWQINFSNLLTLWKFRIRHQELESDDDVCQNKCPRCQATHNQHTQYDPYDPDDDETGHLNYWPSDARPKKTFASPRPTATGEEKAILLSKEEFQRGRKGDPQSHSATHATGRFLLTSATTTNAVFQQTVAIPPPMIPVAQPP